MHSRARQKSFVIRLALASKDRGHLLKYRSALKSTHAVVDYITKSGYGGSSLAIASPELAAGLAKHGVAPRKSLTLEWPGDLLPHHLLRHYLRGYFDGDGGFKAQIRRTGYVALGWAVVGNEEFCLGAQEYLIEAVELRKTKLLRPRNSPRIRRLTYAGRNQVSRIHHLLYADTALWLSRKREYIEPYIRSLSESEPAIPDGRNLRRLRQERTITVAALAAKAGSSHRTVSELENGKRRKVRFSTILNIAEALAVDPNELVDRD